MAELERGGRGGPPLVRADYEGIARCAAMLQAGGVIAYPTETQYGLGADARVDLAVERVALAKGRPEGTFLVIVASAGDLVQVASEVPEPTLRVAQVCWPGPVTVILPARDGLAAGVVAGDGTVAVRVPGHPSACELSLKADAPLVSTSANPTGHDPLLEPAEIARVFGNSIDAVLDDGPLRAGPPSSLVDARRTPVRFLRDGAVSRNSLARRTGLEVEGGSPLPLVLFVCTGNTCRSPMAEGAFRHLIEEQGLGGTLDVASAGISAVHWGRATEEAQRTAWDRGVDLSTHRPRQLDAALVREADLILTVSEEHRTRIGLLDPEARSRTLLIKGLAAELSGRPPAGRREIGDPIGQPPRAYRKVFDQMWKELERGLDGIATRAARRRFGATG